MKELTPQALANVESGATSGPGTDTCAGCEGPKEATRLNSARCRACGSGGLAASPSPSPVRVVRATIPTDVAQRFAAEAAEKGMQTQDLLAALLVARDAKKHPQPSPATE